MGDEGVGSEYLGLLVRPGREAEFLSALAEVLAGDWAVLEFRGLPEGGALARLIPEILGARARERIHCERRPCVRVLLPDDYETYLRTLKPKFRSTLRYRTNRLLKNYAVRLLRTSREEELGIWIASSRCIRSDGRPEGYLARSTIPASGPSTGTWRPPFWAAAGCVFTTWKWTASHEPASSASPSVGCFTPSRRHSSTPSAPLVSVGWG